MAKEEAGSNRYGEDGNSRKSGPPRASAWLGHWTGTTSCGSSVNGPKAPRRYESEEVGFSRTVKPFRRFDVSSNTDFMSNRGELEKVKKERIETWSNAFVDGRENLKLKLGPSGIGNLDLSSGKLANHLADTYQLESPSNVALLDLSTPAPHQSFLARRKGINEDNSHMKEFSGRKGKQRMHTSSVMNLFAKDTDSTDGNGFQGFSRWSHAAPKMQLTPDVESKRIRTSTDSFDIVSSRSPRDFSQTFQNLKSTRTGMNAAYDERTFKDASVASELKGKAAREFLTLSYDFASEEANTVSLKPLDSSKFSTDEIFDAVKCSGVDPRNESSAETEPMDLDFLLESNPSGVAPSSLNKDGNEESRLPISVFLATPFRNSVQSRVESSELHDMEKEVSVVPGTTEPIEDEASTSRTESLDAEYLVSSIGNATYQKSDFGLDRDMKLEDCNRWVKRLKPSYSLAFAYGTKCSMKDEDTYHSNTPKLFNKILRCSRSSSEPILIKPNEQETPGLDQYVSVMKSSKPPSINENLDRKGSHPWIRRWCHKSNPYREKKHEGSVLGNVNKYPSVAAMALMRNAMNGYRHCSIRKKGPVMVWNMDC